MLSQYCLKQVVIGNNEKDLKLCRSASMPTPTLNVLPGQRKVDNDFSTSSGDLEVQDHPFYEFDRLKGLDSDVTGREVRLRVYDERGYRKSGRRQRLDRNSEKPCQECSDVAIQHK
jgi:hypothetical protein